MTTPEYRLPSASDARTHENIAGDATVLGATRQRRRDARRQDDVNVLLRVGQQQVGEPLKSGADAIAGRCAVTQEAPQPGRFQEDRMVGRIGIEPMTLGLRVPCSTS